MGSTIEKRSQILLLLLCVLQEGAEKQTTVVGKVGNSTKLHCVKTLPRILPLNKLRVSWQTLDDKVVHAFLSGNNGEMYQAPEYQGRTQLFLDKLQSGDFSLLLSNLSLSDSQTYKCIVKKNETRFRLFHQDSITLNVGASYRPLELSGPELIEVEFGEEVTLNCSAINGYPKPKIHWTDATNTSLPAPVTTSQSDVDRYSVFSMLKLNATIDQNLSCIIENQLLQENLTVRQFLLKVRNNGTLPIHDKQMHDFTQATIGTSCVFIIVAFVGAAIWLCKRKSFSRLYKGVQDTENCTQEGEENGYL